MRIEVRSDSGATIATFESDGYLPSVHDVIDINSGASRHRVKERGGTITRTNKPGEADPIQGWFVVVEAYQPV
jgi:hypothetical protein